jgi:hypothetical protein
VTDEEERQAILAAMQRLFAGTPLQSSGNLDIVALADEAGLKRNKLTHKHPDLKDQFYAERRARDGVSDREVKLHNEIALLKARIDPSATNGTTTAPQARYSPAQYTSSPLKTTT